MEFENKMLKVLLVDDSPLFREGLSKLLESCPDMQVVGQAEDGSEVLEKARETEPDVVIMDIFMPRCDGFEATKMIKEEMPKVKVIMLTVSESEDNLFRAIKLGAHGYLLKSVDSRELFQVLRGLSRGESYVAPNIAAKILQEFTKPNHKKDSLSQRERDVLRLVVEGLTNKEIAKALNIAESTVKNHLHNTMEKLHVNNRLEAAIHYLDREKTLQE